MYKSYNLSKSLSAISVFVLSGFLFGSTLTSPSWAMEIDADYKKLSSWQYTFNICEPSGEVVQKQIANNPVYLHGFDSLHAQGIKGQGTTIAFIEEGVDSNHPQFKPNQVNIIDCSQYKEIIGERDMSIYRNQRNLNFGRLMIAGGERPKFSNRHGNHVMGMPLSQPGIISYIADERTTSNEPRGTVVGARINEFKDTLYSANHPGGSCPEAKGILYAISHSRHVFLSEPKPYGMSILSFNQLKARNLLEKSVYNPAIDDYCTIEEYFTQLTPPLTSEETYFMDKIPIEGSTIKALEEALAGPAFAINWSYTPSFLMDPTNQYKVPQKLLDKIGRLAKRNDKVIVFCAGNDQQCLEQRVEAEFYRQILNHPILSKRVVFSVNVCPTISKDPMKIGKLRIKNHHIPFKLYNSTNYPGETFKSICLSAMGSNVISGYSQNGFERHSGTSEAAPIIASLATLVKQKFPEMNGPPK